MDSIDDLDVLTDAELSSLSRELSIKLSSLTAETLVFESFLLRMLPGPGIGSTNGGDGLPDGARDDETLPETSKPRNGIPPNGQSALGNSGNDTTGHQKKKKTDKTKESDRPVLLSLDEKTEIGLREIEELRDAIQGKKEDWARVLDNYRVISSFSYFILTVHSSIASHRTQGGTRRD